MTKAKQWIEDHREAEQRLGGLKRRRPVLQLQWQLNGNPRPGDQQPYAYPIFQLNDHGDIFVCLGENALFTIEPHGAIRLAKFLQSLYQESVSPIKEG